jgi:hypothetical protein
MDLVQNSYTVSAFRNGIWHAVSQCKFFIYPLTDFFILLSLMNLISSGHVCCLPAQFQLFTFRYHRR